ncbi:protease modulator HflC [Enterobacteriaceae endosymbiont of Plateumaris consimilis]|uniref:protease modulator HflC n=1 Tax=Enterobacteriaceae endosymbiont of Plateumaris consimilis TaxID=2675794 RepID=UPI001448DC4F|nr:protease modulator HflC [Enterobacteriaceae endosymbiont of Plateumaris consimilis]QJC28587.1 protease modulator HflC [Enterobacteriaceae endosymbiont of Plateumaris consimilis]
MYKCLIYLLIILLNFFYLSVFIINEGYVGIHICNNNYKTKDIITIYKPGLYFKIPFLNTIKILHTGLLNTNFEIGKFVLNSKKDLIIKGYIIWKIIDFKKYISATNGNLIQTEIILKKKFSEKLQFELDKLNIENIFNNDDEFSIKNLLNCNYNTIKNLKKNFISQLIFQNNNKIIINNLADIGISIIDVRIKNVLLSKEILKSIFDRINYEKKYIIYNQENQAKEIAEKIKCKIKHKNIILINNI